MQRHTFGYIKERFEGRRYVLLSNHHRSSKYKCLSPRCQGGGNDLTISYRLQ